MADGDNAGGGNEEQQATLDLTTITIKDLVQKDKRFQEELNTLMADNKRSLTKQNQDLVTQLEQLKQNSRLTQEERDDLQTRITQVEEQYMSKEELTKRESGKREKEYEQNIGNINKERDSWKNMYSSETIDRSIQDAAIEGGALHPSQIVDLLRGRTQLVEVLDSSGQPTGRYSPIIKFNDVDEDNNPVALELAPAEAIKRMKELADKYGNLFEGTSSGGLGEEGGGTGGKGVTLMKDVLSDPAKYAEWRKKNPDLDLNKLRR